MLGLYRVVAFHPLFRPNYLRWLKSTPWTVRKPLPWGPLELVPKTALGMGLLIVLSATVPTPRSIELIIVFLFSHVLVLAAYVLADGAGGLRLRRGHVSGFRASASGHVPGLISCCLDRASISWCTKGCGARCSVFPGRPRAYWPTYRCFTMTAGRIPRCGWFFDRFHRDVAMARGISRIDAILGCMLGSWWLFVLASLVPDRNDRFAFLFLCSDGCDGDVCHDPARDLHSGLSSADQLPGSDRHVPTGSFPAYDQVLVAPICFARRGDRPRSPFTGTREFRFEITLSVAAGLAVLVALVGPPRLKRWRLTGEHRLVPTSQESQAASLHRMGQP